MTCSSRWAAGPESSGVWYRALRHAFASNVLDAGGALDEVQDLLGHASIGSTQIYAHPATERLRRAVERVPSPRVQAVGEDAK